MVDELIREQLKKRYAMNRHFIFAGIFMLLGLCAAAQPADSTAVDSLRRIGDVDTGPVTMRRAADGDNMVLEVAGFGITIGPSTIQGASNRDTKIPLASAGQRGCFSTGSKWASIS